MMLSDVDAVIAALRVVLREVETHTNFSRTNAYWKTHIVNKWIYQLPGARWGRWRELRFRPDYGDFAERPNLIMHVRATLAYLETNRETIAAHSRGGRSGGGQRDRRPRRPQPWRRKSHPRRKSPGRHRGYRIGRRSPSG